MWGLLKPIINIVTDITRNRLINKNTTKGVGLLVLLVD